MIRIILGVLLIATTAFGQGRLVEGDKFKGGNPFQKNYIKNPLVDRDKIGITDASGIASISTSSPIEAPASLLIDGTADNQLVIFATNSLDSFTYGQNCEARFIYNGDASLYKAYVRQNSTAVTPSDDTLAILQNVPNSKLHSINFPCGDGSSGATDLVIETTSASAAAIKVDLVYIGLATNVGTVAQPRMLGTLTYASNANCRWQNSTTGAWTSYSADTDCLAPTVTGDVTAPATKIPGFVLASVPAGRLFVIARGFYYNGTGGNTENGYRLFDGTTGFANSFSYVNAQVAGSLVGSVEYTSAQSNLTVQIQAAQGSVAPIEIVNTQFPMSLTFEVWLFPAPQQGVRMDQSNYDWTAYTPIFTGFGTVTSIDCWHRRLGPDLLIRCKAVSGSSTATEAQISLPGSLVSSTLKVASIQKAGGFIRSGNYSSSIFGTHTLIESSKAYVVFGVEGTGTSGFTKQNGSGIVGAGETFFVDARVPIEGWTENQNAPLIVGGVTTKYAGNAMSEAAEINCDASSAITSSSGFLSSVGNRSTTSCALTISSGVFSTTPWSCQVTIKATTVQATACSCSSSTSCTIYGPNADYDAYVKIDGPR